MQARAYTHTHIPPLDQHPNQQPGSSHLEVVLAAHLVPSKCRPWDLWKMKGSYPPLPSSLFRRAPSSLAVIREAASPRLSQKGPFPLIRWFRVHSMQACTPINRSELSDLNVRKAIGRKSEEGYKPLLDGLAGCRSLQNTSIGRRKTESKFRFQPVCVSVHVRVCVHVRAHASVTERVCSVPFSHWHALRFSADKTPR